MNIMSYSDQYKNQIISLILHIQNDEARINLSVEEQPDLLDINKSYIEGGGNFWLAFDNGQVIGTIALMNYGNHNAVLKKFFVREDYRSQKVGLKLYKKFHERAEEQGFKIILLDTPSVATASHRFYEKNGFIRIAKRSIPCEYTYPDRDSYLYMLHL